jgi:hypothetical protein
LIQRAYAYERAAALATEAKAMEHTAAMIEDIKKAMDAGYPAAFFRMAQIQESGQGLKRNRDKAEEFSSIESNPGVLLVLRRPSAAISNRPEQ